MSKEVFEMKVYENPVIILESVGLRDIITSSQSLSEVIFDPEDEIRQVFGSVSWN